jgi:homoserine kinase
MQIGLALSMYLDLQVTIDPSETGHPLNCKITYEGDRAEEVSLDPEMNLVTRTALWAIMTQRSWQS